jgi:Spy/CpxP family protein refolding chaperone
MIDRHARRIAVLLLGIGLLAIQATPAQADGRWHHRMERRFQERLGLSDDQMKAIREVHQRQAPTSRQVWQQLRQAQQELRRLALAGGDESAVAAKAGEVKNLLAQMVDLRVNARREIAQILTPEQRQKLASLHFGGHRRHHGRHHDHGEDS